jgi:hypothetical protein
VLCTSCSQDIKQNPGLKDNKVMLTTSYYEIFLSQTKSESRIVTLLSDFLKRILLFQPDVMSAVLTTSSQQYLYKTNLSHKTQNGY